MRLTLARLANLQQHAWELQRELGFHMQSPRAFQEHVAAMRPLELQNLMENLGLLFRTVEEIGQAEIELVASGEHSMWAPLCKTQTAQAIGADENIVRVPAETSPEPASA